MTFAKLYLYFFMCGNRTGTFERKGACDKICISWSLLRHTTEKNFLQFIGKLFLGEILERDPDCKFLGKTYFWPFRIFLFL